MNKKKRFIDYVLSENISDVKIERIKYEKWVPDKGDAETYGRLRMSVNNEQWKELGIWRQNKDKYCIRD